MQDYKIIDVMGNFETMVGKIISAKNVEDAKEFVIEYIRENIDKYLYAVVEEVK